MVQQSLNPGTPTLSTYTLKSDCSYPETLKLAPIALSSAFVPFLHVNLHRGELQVLLPSE
jgi:hypothetical protein